MGRPRKVIADIDAAPKVNMEEKEFSTPQHEQRTRQAKKEKEKRNQPAVKDEWFEYVMQGYIDHRKGRKIVMKRLTENGVTTEYLGFEKKIPASFMKKVKANLRQPKED